MLKVLDANVYNLVNRATRRLRFVYSWLRTVEQLCAGGRLRSFAIICRGTVTVKYVYVYS